MRRAELIFNGSIDTLTILRYPPKLLSLQTEEPVTNEVSFVGDGVTSGVKETSIALSFASRMVQVTGSIARGAIRSQCGRDNASIVLADTTYDLHD